MCTSAIGGRAGLGLRDRSRVGKSRRVDTRDNAVTAGLNDYEAARALWRAGDAAAAVRRAELAADAAQTAGAAELAVEALDLGISLLGVLGRLDDIAPWLARVHDVAAEAGDEALMARAELLTGNWHLAARRTFPEVAHPTQCAVRVTATPFFVDGAPTHPSGSPPYRVGQHTREVLIELGYHDNQIQTLRTESTIEIAG